MTSLSSSEFKKLKEKLLDANDINVVCATTKETKISSCSEEDILEKINQIILASNSGKSIEFVWQGTSLGVRLEGETNYQFTNLIGQQGVKGDSVIGPQGVKGDHGDPFAIKKIYSSVYDMEADYSGTEVSVGEFVIIATPNPSDPTNGHLYIKGDSAYNFIVGMAGMVGVQGPKGEQGIQGVKGDDGKSSYQVAVDNGFQGTETEWINAIAGNRAYMFYDNEVGGDKDGVNLIFHLSRTPADSNVVVYRNGLPLQTSEYGVTASSGLITLNSPIEQDESISALYLVKTTYALSLEGMPSIMNDDYELLSNKPAIDGNVLSKHTTLADLNLLSGTQIMAGFAVLNGSDSQDFSTANLTTKGSATIEGTLTLNGGTSGARNIYMYNPINTHRITSGATGRFVIAREGIKNDLIIDENGGATFYGNVTVAGTSTLTGLVRTSGNLEVGGTYVTINGNTVYHTGNFNPTNKADAVVVTKDLVAATKTITIANNNDYKFGTLTTLIITLPTEDYSASLSFSSGATATTFTFPSEVKWLGVDLFGDTFVPKANKRYNIVFWHDGINHCGIVGGV